MHGFAGAGAIAECFLYLGIVVDAAGSYGLVYFHKVLIYNAAASYIEMSHLGVAHLAVGQSHIFAAGLQLRMGICGQQMVVVGFGSTVDSVGVAVGTYAPTVEDNQ